MRADLDLDIAVWLAAHPEGGTATEIARGVQARLADVIQALGSGRFSDPTTVGRSPHVRQVWTLAPAPQGKAGKGNAWPGVNAGSQNSQVLAVLADRKWHTSRDLHRRVFCILHSRIAELRKIGYSVEHRGGGPGAELHEYRLISVPAAAEAAA